MLFYLQKLFVTKKNELLLEIKFDNLIMFSSNGLCLMGGE